MTISCVTDLVCMNGFMNKIIKCLFIIFFCFSTSITSIDIEYTDMKYRESTATETQSMNLKMVTPLNNSCCTASASVEAPERY